jgi:putative ABC transport system permease protein
MPSQAAPTPATAKAETAPKQPPSLAAKRRDMSRLSLLWEPLSRVFEMARFVLKRQYHHPGVTLLALLGIVLAVGLVTNVSCFSQASTQLILNQKLAEFSHMTGRPAFSTTAYTLPSSRQPISVEAAEQAASDVANTLVSEVGLPLKHLGVQVESGGMMLQPQEGSVLYGGESYLGSIDLAYIAEVQNHLTIVEGDPLDGGTSGDMLDVWIPASLADTMGVHIGNEFRIGKTLASAAVPIRVRGTWQASDPTDDFWFVDPDGALKETLLVRRQDYITFVEPLIPSKTEGVYWYIILDESKVYADVAEEYIEGFERGLVVINQYLPDVKLDSPPLGPLKEFVAQETTLTTLLLSFNLPAFGFLLYFLVLTSAITARWQRRDIAVLVSRGVQGRSILSLTVIEELLLFVVGFPIGVCFGIGLALSMGYTSSFLSFVSRPPIPVSLRGVNVPLALVALSTTLITRLSAAAQSTRYSIVEVEREHARPMRAPFWHRYYLDLLLIFPTVYAYQQLTSRGTLAALVQDHPENLYQDPLLVLVPGLFILAAALLTLRILPLVMRLVDALAGIIPWITPHLTLRQLSRHSSSHINPLLLLIVSLALGSYMMSMASSLDQWLIDRMYYRVGADLAFEPYPASMLDPTTSEGDEVADLTSGIWIPRPDEFLTLPGVTAVTRVGDFTADINITGDDDIDGRFLAIDRAAFPAVAWFRQDFAQEPLGTLMNRLALTPDAILVPQQLFREYPLQIGDRVAVRVLAARGTSFTSFFTVVGAYEYFPTVYEEDGPTVIGNLEHLSDVFGFYARHHIWLDVQEGTDGQAVFQAIPEMQRGIEAIRQRDAPALIAEEKTKMERVGVFGSLSIGFMAAVAMAGIGLLLYSYASLRERLYRLAVLRAIGLDLWQIAIQITMEYTLLTVCGVAVGAFIGAVASTFFAPFFTVTGEEGVPLPPLMPIIDQQHIACLTGIFAIVMVLLGVIAIARTFSRRNFDMLRAHWG